jgi:hypothetical protein
MSIETTSIKPRREAQIEMPDGAGMQQRKAPWDAPRMTATSIASARPTPRPAEPATEPSAPASPSPGKWGIQGDGSWLGFPVG